MSTVEPGHDDEIDSPSQRWIIYVVLLLALVVGIVVAFAVQQNHQSQKSAAKAVQLSAALVHAGLSPIRPRVAEAVFGTDGGIVCASANGDFLDNVGANGAAGPGVRPTDTQLRLLTSTRIVIRVYCPDQTASFDSFVSSLNLDRGVTTTDQGSQD